MFSQEIKSYRSGTTRGWVNTNDNIQFWVDCPFKITKFYLNSHTKIMASLFFLIHSCDISSPTGCICAYQTSSASTSHSAPNWQMSQVDVSFCPFSAEPSFPAWIHKDETRQHKLPKVWQILLGSRWAGNHSPSLFVSFSHTNIHK